MVGWFDETCKENVNKKKLVRLKISNNESDNESKVLQRNEGMQNSTEV